jgi:hypothetical protein
MLHDTGTTDHLTHELSKLNPRDSYSGHDQVRTTNGLGMHISHIGQTSLLTHTTKTIPLLNVLRVPSVTCNLISIPNLTLDNDVFVEFHRFIFC